MLIRLCSASALSRLIVTAIITRPTDPEELEEIDLPEEDVVEEDDEEVVEEDEEEVVEEEEDSEAIGEDEVVEDAKYVADKVHLMEKKIDHFVSEELKEIFEEMYIN